MKIIFVIKDEAHSDIISRHDTFESALEALKSYRKIPWNQEPNRCPCTSWKTCSREYKIVECEVVEDKWKCRNETQIFDISAVGITWHYDFIDEKSL